MVLNLIHHSFYNKPESFQTESANNNSLFLFESSGNTKAEILFCWPYFSNFCFCNIFIKAFIKKNNILILFVLIALEFRTYQNEIRNEKNSKKLELCVARSVNNRQSSLKVFLHSMEKTSTKVDFSPISRKKAPFYTRNGHI